MAKKYKCVVSGKDIPKERVEALRSLNIPEDMWTCVEHSLTKPRQGVYLGEVGTSELLIVDKVYNDSVRSVFKGSRKEIDDYEEEVEDEPATKDTDKDGYNEKELKYYRADEDFGDPEEKIEIIKRHQP
jgi:hypothetical protein